MTTDNRAELEAALREARDAFAAFKLWEAPWGEENSDRVHDNSARMLKRIDAALSSPPSDQERGLEEAHLARLIVEDVSCIERPTQLSIRTVERAVYAARKIVFGDGLNASSLPDLPAPSPPTVEHAAPQAEVERRVEELPMIAFSERLPVRDELNGEQTILTYSENVGVFSLEFFESGWDFPDRWLGASHWLDITGMWPGVTAQVTEFRDVVALSPSSSTAELALRVIVDADPGPASPQSLAFEMAAIARQALSSPPDAISRLDHHKGAD